MSRPSYNDLLVFCLEPKTRKEIQLKFGLSNTESYHEMYLAVYKYKDMTAKNDDGTPLTIYYQHIPIMLLAEVQRLNKIVEQLQIKSTI